MSAAGVNILSLGQWAKGSNSGVDNSGVGIHSHPATRLHFEGTLYVSQFGAEGAVALLFFA